MQEMLGWALLQEEHSCLHLQGELKHFPKHIKLQAYLARGGGVSHYSILRQLCSTLRHHCYLATACPPAHLLICSQLLSQSRAPTPFCPRIGKGLEPPSCRTSNDTTTMPNPGKSCKHCALGPDTETVLQISMAALAAGLTNICCIWTTSSPSSIPRWATCIVRPGGGRFCETGGAVFCSGSLHNIKKHIKKFPFQILSFVAR